MRFYFSVCFLLFLAWATMVFAAFFIPFPLLPDVVVVIAVYLHYFVPAVPQWRCVLPVSLLMDMAAHVFFGFHGLLYAVAALSVAPVRRSWQYASFFERSIAVVAISIAFQVAKFLLYFLVAGIPVPPGWYQTIAAQIVIWPFVGGLSGWFVRRYFARALS